MSKDYKLGILFGLLVLGAGVIYWVALDKPEKESPEQPKTEASKVEVVDVSGSTTENITVIETPPAVEETIPNDVAPVGGATTPATETPETTTYPVEVPPAPADPSKTTGTGFQLEAGADSALTAEDPVIDPTPVPVPDRVDIKGKKTYTVRDGDDGFSVLSKRFYGTPKHWKLIANANPGVLSTALRPGMKLKIPPRPVEDLATQLPTSPTTHGKTLTNAAGQQIYVVASSDTNGFWGISEKVYGKGKGHLYPLIRDANPKTDTTKLRAGMKLIIPPAKNAKLIVTATPRSRNGAQPGQTVTIDGKQHYIVKAGDAGFGYIAKKVYGSARYAYLIKNANPNANTTTLMPRDKLVIPPKPAGEAPSAPRTRTTRPARSDSGRPYFGN